MNYPDIYYLGFPGVKVSPGCFDLPTHQYKANARDHIAYRYEIVSTFGRGAFGQVLRCEDHKTHETVALKIVINTRQMRNQARAEMEFVQFLNREDPSGSSHIIKLLDTFEFRGHICASFEPLGHNLYEHFKRSNFRAMPITDVRRIGRQLFQTLAFIHSRNIVHCDIKPENILLVPHCTPLTIRVIDFGSSCAVGQRHFDYIQSRFYRAPEVILGLAYGPPIDIWSVACVIAEMLTGRALFGGDCETAQLQLQMGVLGPPPTAIVTAAPRRALFFHPDGAPRRAPASPRRRIPRIDDPQLLDLLKQCLEWDQNKRITAEHALAHAFFENVDETPPEQVVKVSPRRTGGNANANVNVSRSPRGIRGKVLGGGGGGGGGIAPKKPGGGEKRSPRAKRQMRN